MNNNTMINKGFIVDDNSDLRAVLSDIFIINGFNTLYFEDGTSFISQYHGELGVVLLDVNMPKMNGLEVQKFINNKGFTPPIIFISGNEKYGIHAMNNGAFDFIHKPFNNQALVNSVRLAMKSQNM